MKSIWAADIEFLKGEETPFFSFVAEDVHSDEVFEFYIYGEHDGRDKFFEWIRNRKPGLVGFNCLGTYRDPGYDAYVLDTLIRNPKISIHDFYKENNRIFKMNRIPMPEWKLRVKWLDLLTVWHFDNRARRTSLKWLMYMFDWPIIDEVEFDDIVVDYDSVERVLFYNRNDTAFTKFFYKITKGETSDPLYSGKDKIEFRKIINKEFGFNCLNWNDVKIGDRLNKKLYLSRTGLDRKTKFKNTERREIAVSDCVEPYIKFETEQYSRFYNWFIKQVFDPKSLPGKAREIKYKNLTLSFGFGGLHSIDPKRLLRSDDKSFLIDADVW